MLLVSVTNCGTLKLTPKDIQSTQNYEHIIKIKMIMNNTFIISQSAANIVIVNAIIRWIDVY